MHFVKLKKIFMINLREIMVGNFILDHEGIVREVDYVGNGVIGLINGIGGIQKYQFSPIFSLDIGDLKPIKLTDEVLIDCGYELDTKERTFKHPCGVWLLKEKNGSYYAYGLRKGVDLIHLHRLQNLVFDLTNERLIYNPKK